MSRLYEVGFFMFGNKKLVFFFAGFSQFLMATRDCCKKKIGQTTQEKGRMSLKPFFFSSSNLKFLILNSRRHN